MNNKINAGPSFGNIKLIKTVEMNLEKMKITEIDRTLGLADDCRLAKEILLKTENKDINVFTKQVEGTDKFNFYKADGEEAKILNGLEQIKNNINNEKLPNDNIEHHTFYFGIKSTIQDAIEKTQDGLLQMHKLLIK